MKPLTRRSFTAAGILAALGLTGCDGFNPFNNRPESVYGPPPDYYDQKRGENDDGAEPADGGSATDAPDDAGATPDDAEGGNGNDSSDDFDPSQNEIMDVYGPPEDFDPANDMVEGVYGPPNATASAAGASRESAMGPAESDEWLAARLFSPRDNVPVCVYGPPPR